MRSSFFSEYISDPVSCFPIILYQVLPERLSLSALALMTDHVALLQRAGLPVAISIPTEEI